MTITQERFDLLVRKLEDFADRQPRNYRLRVALFAILGYAYIFGILACLLALVGLLVFLIVFSHRLNAYMIKLAWVLLVPVWLIGRSLWITFPPPEGLLVTRGQFPKLFALVDELTTKLQAPTFHKILLNQEFNAGVRQIPRLGIFGWQENYLVLGLPLMQSLSLEQLTAVLAHELGHLSGNHSRFGAWIYRLRLTWLLIYQRFHQKEQQGALILFNSFLEWYWPSFNAYSFVLARLNEYEADRCSAELAGPKNIAAALINTEIKARFLESSFWKNIQKQVEHQPDPPHNTYSGMLTALHSPIPQEEAQQWLTDALAQKTNNSDTHPCLTDRLKGLGYATVKNEKIDQLVTIKKTAAAVLLGDKLQEFANQFDRDWQQATATSWRQQYGYLQQLRNKLAALNEKAKNQKLDEQELAERVFYTLELQGGDVAIPLLEEVLKNQPNHGSANYYLGQILLEKGDEAGITYLEKAINNMSDLLVRNDSAMNDTVINACQLIYDFWSKRGQTEEAEKYHERAKEIYKLMLQAQGERNNISDRDKFKRHTLKAPEVNNLKQHLATYNQIKEAYLVEKVLNYFPENRFFVLGIVRNKSWLEVQDEAQNLINVLTGNMELTVDTYIIILNHGNTGKLKKKMAQIEQSLIFSR